MVIRPADGALMIDVAGWRLLVDRLTSTHRTIGPVLADGVIRLGPVSSADELPVGWTAEQAPGRYRAASRDDRAWFGWAVGDSSWRREVAPPREVLVRIRSTPGSSFGVEPVLPDPGDDGLPVAWLGMRACDLSALVVTDRVFLGGSHPDAHYGARRTRPLMIAVDCAEPGGTCFCASMGTGPSVDRASLLPDLRVTELLGSDRHEFMLRPDSDAGRRLVADLPGRPVTAEDLAASAEQSARAVQAMGLELSTEGLRESLRSTLDDPHWDDVASRCLSCTNCTLVCPTCFCNTVEVTTDLTGTATRARVWDSCFTLGHSYVHGGAVHADVRSRYRQWLTHKLDTWWDQFEMGGCVGCGRCITWCPVGIDIVAEATVLQQAADRDQEVTR